MIKLEHHIFYERGVVAFAAEASSDKDLPTLDLLCQALTDKPNVKVGFITSKRLSIHVYGMDESLFKDENGKVLKKQ